MPPHHAKGGEHAGACGPNRTAILWGWPSCVSDSPRAKHGTQVWRQSPAHDPAPAMGARQKKERIVKPVRRPGHMPELKSRLQFCFVRKSLLSSIVFSARGHAFAFSTFGKVLLLFCTGCANFGRLRGLCLFCGRNPCRARTARASRPRAPLTAALLSWTQAISRKRGKPVFFEGGCQSQRSTVNGGACGAYCRWLSGCSSSWQCLHSVSSCRWPVSGSNTLKARSGRCRRCLT